jgi:endoglucanase
VTSLLALIVTLGAPPVVDPDIQVISAYHISVRLPDGAQVSDESDGWAILSADDPNYQSIQSPDLVFLRGYPIRLIPEGWPYPSVMEYRAILKLPSPLTPGVTYQIGATEAGYDFEYTHVPELKWTPSLKVNQIGYLPEAVGRWAYISYWLGRLGAMALPEDQRQFSVVNSESNAVVHRGVMSLRMPHDQMTEDAYMGNYSQANIYEINLFQVVMAGTYHIVWEGVGRSWSFEVGDDVYDHPFVTTFKALYHQRCGMELLEQFTPFTRGACHTRPVVLSNYDMFGEGDAFEGLPREATEETIELVGGYHDAGDYDRRVQHLAVVDSLVDLYEIAPERFARDDLGIPESGNGVPDVLDEAKWGVDFFRRLQENHGGVRGGVETTGHPDGWETRPEDDTGTIWYAFAPSALSSYRYASGAAKLARALRDWDEGAARDFLDSAIRAFSWAEANRSEDMGETYWDAQAAAELLKTTGSAEYDQAFIAHMPFRENDLVFSLPRYVSDSIIPAMLAYAGIERASAEHRAAIETVLRDRSTYWIDSARGTGYRFVKHPFAPVTFGSYTTPVYAGYLFRLYALYGGDEFKEWGTYTCDLTLGTNPAGLSWVTGLGSHAVAKPLHLHSLTDDIEVPVPGITVYGPCASGGCQTSEGILAAARTRFVPEYDQWPPGERFADLSYVPVYNEFTVQESIAPTVFAFGYLAVLADGLRAGGAGGSGGSGGTGGTGGGSASGGAGGGSSNTGGTAGQAGGSPMGGNTGMMGGAGGQGASDGGVGSLPDGGERSQDDQDSGCRTFPSRQTNNISLFILLMIGLSRRVLCRHVR